jgi:dolichol-phosphate mannosyltransferase
MPAGDPARTPSAHGGSPSRGIVVVLPAYNEGARIEALLDRLHTTLAARPYRIVVVDDGSSDETAAVLARRSSDLPLVSITHTINRGLAQTLFDGLQWAADHAGENDVVVTMDADDTHDPAHIPAMLGRLDDGFDVVIASRFQRGSQVIGVPLHRQIFSYGVLVLLRLFLPIRGVRDYACGYRAVRAPLVRQAVREFGNDLFHLRSWGFICTAELLWKLHVLGARCAEVPFVLRYDLKESVSRMRAGRTIAGYGLLVWNAWRQPNRRAGRPAAGATKG